MNEQEKSLEVEIVKAIAELTQIADTCGCWTEH